MSLIPLNMDAALATWPVAVVAIVVLLGLLAIVLSFGRSHPHS